MFAAPSSRYAIIGAVLTAIVGYGAVAWVSTFLVRSHGLNFAQAGVFLARWGKPQSAKVKLVATWGGIVRNSLGAIQLAPFQGRGNAR